MDVQLAEAVELGEAAELASIPEEVVLEHPHGYIVRVVGDGMSPTIEGHELVFVDPDIQPQPNQKMQIVVIQVRKIRDICRIVKMTNDSLKLIHDNRRYPHVRVPRSRCEISGTVVWASEYHTVM